MRRREFITLIGGAAATWTLVVRAQQAGKVNRVGFLGSATAAGSAKAVESLRTGLREFGYVEGLQLAGQPFMTHAGPWQPPDRLFDHLLGAGEEGGRDRAAKRLHGPGHD